MTAAIIAFPAKERFAPPEARAYEARTMAADDTERMSEGGLEAVFMICRSSLLRFFAARGYRDDADDLLQELWIKVGAAPGGPIAEPKAYLFRMADNLILDHRRAGQRRAKRDDQWTVATRGSVIDMSEAPSADRTLIARDQLRIVDRAIDALGERTATIFRSYRIDGVNQRDIATRTGISVSAVEKHLQKAYRALVNIRTTIDADSSTPRRPGGEGSSDGHD